MTTTEDTMNLANSDEDEEDLFNDDGDDVSCGDADAPSPKKRRLMTEEKKKVDPSLVEHAKKRLSKWAARLFDPDRPRGLVEVPQVIPLNDEFLKDFGRREKEFDKARGREVTIETTINSDDDDDDDEETNKAATSKTTSAATKKEGGKVKITNLAYRTSGARLQQACEKFGPLIQVNMILDKERQGGPTVLNSGRAYVTFEHAESAQTCVDNLKELDGRQLRLSVAVEKSKTFSHKSSGSALNRYWERDISTVCYRCGQVGHIEPNCTNTAKARPCPLCAKVDHDQKTCPYNRICFNCGCPGHVNRECQHPRGLPKRIVCGICFQSGHHRLQCRSRPCDAPSVHAAICMVCAKRGHFLCQDMKWFYGLQGLSCFNCGSQGHSGYDCQRPNLYQCLQDPELTNQEIERAEANSLAEQLEQQRQQRGRQMEREGGNKRGFRSLPPQRRGDRGGGGDQQRGYRQTSGGGGDSQQHRRGYSGGGDRRGGGGGDPRRQSGGGDRSRGYR